MDAVILPSYAQYKDVVDRMVTSDELTTEQGIILLKCFRARLDETACHVNYLMQCTGLDWKRINYVLNGLVCRGAIRRIEEKYYTV